MTSSFLSSENHTEISNLTTPYHVQISTSTNILYTESNLWSDLKSLFNLPYTSLILSIICIIFFLLTSCLLFILIKLLKDRRSSENLKLNSQAIDHTTLLQSKNTSSPFQMPSTSQRKHAPAIDDDQIETVNEVLAMEERHGKIFYRVNFTGHASDYTAWVCEDDLIPE